MCKIFRINTKPIWNHLGGITYSSSSMLRICFSLCGSLRFVYPCLSRSIIVIQAIHARFQCGRLSCGDKKLFWSLGDGDRRRWGKVNWLERYFCWLEPSLSVTIISVISSSATNFCCILGQTDALRTSHTPNYTTWLDICKLDQN